MTCAASGCPRFPHSRDGLWATENKTAPRGAPFKCRCRDEVLGLLVLDGLFDGYVALGLLGSLLHKLDEGPALGRDALYL